MMHDGKALQTATSHNFGSDFAQAFDITYTDKENKRQFVHQTSWGLSARLIGGIIMAHGDDNGLVLPPKVAPIQVVIVPIASHKEGVKEKAYEIENILSRHFRVKLDVSDRTPGWKYAEYEMKGVPIRLEIGPKDIEKGQCVLVLRDNAQRITASLDSIVEEVQMRLYTIHKFLFERAKQNRESRTYTAFSVDELREKLDETAGFVKAMWCGERACEDAVKEQATATSRLMPFIQESVGDTCFVCGEPSKTMVICGRAY